VIFLPISSGVLPAGKLKIVLAACLVEEQLLSEINTIRKEQLNNFMLNCFICSLLNG
jgi:hypothetical protein